MLPNKKITCLAVDDEPLCLLIIEKFIKDVSMLSLAGTCTNAIDALPLLRNKPIDLLFLDIQMPYISGTDFIRTLHNPPKVIFTTGFKKYAVEGFELDAIDYLVKPITFERFLKAVNKVIRVENTNTERLQADDSANNNSGFICLRSDRKNVKINFNDILFIESLQDYCKVVTKDKAVITKQAISVLAENLPPQFIRIHRSYIVSMNKIESYTPEIIQVDKHQLPVSRTYRHEVETALDMP